MGTQGRNWCFRKSSGSRLQGITVSRISNEAGTECERVSDQGWIKMEFIGLVAELTGGLKAFEALTRIHKIGTHKCQKNAIKLLFSS